MNKTNSEGHLIGPAGQSVWLSVYPPGIRGVLNWVSNRYGHPLIYMFENGVSVPHESDIPIAQALHDDFRVDMYRGYIKNMIDAVTIDGVNLKSYFAWSLMDNFEWADGYHTRFGLTYIDYKNDQKRYIKDSFIWYSMFTQTYDYYPKFINPYFLEHPDEDY
jgi:beta-glucosidase